MNKNGNIILSSLNEIESNVKNDVAKIPEGYIQVNLSTKGKLGAPKTVHIRNFKVGELLTLSLTNDYDMPIKLSQILNDMIWEDVDIYKWHEKEVEELMVYLFMTFYKQSLEVNYPFTTEELNNLEDKETSKNILEGKYVPKCTVNIATDVETYDIPSDFNPRIKITSKKSGFYVVFDFIKYGDQIIIKRWLDSFFKDDEIRFKKLREQLNYNNSLNEQLKEDPAIIDKVIYIDPEEKAAYDDYVTKRIQVLTEIVRLISIVNVNGEDVSDLSLSEKYDKLSNDARIDAGLINKLNALQKNQNFGLKPDVTMTNPLTREVVKRPLSFRISSVIQAMQLSSSDEYDYSVGDED